MNPVICGVDGWDSESGSPGAVRLARLLAGRFESPVVFVTVVDAAVGKAGREQAETLLRHVVETTSGVDASYVVEGGHPADRLVALATEREASFLVVGNHGPRSSALGSISADVARRAPCPVVVVPTTASRAEME